MATSNNSLIGMVAGLPMKRPVRERLRSVTASSNNRLVRVIAGLPVTRPAKEQLRLVLCAGSDRQSACFLGQCAQFYQIASQLPLNARLKSGCARVSDVMYLLMQDVVDFDSDAGKEFKMGKAKVLEDHMNLGTEMLGAKYRETMSGALASLMITKPFAQYFR